MTDDGTPPGQGSGRHGAEQSWKVDEAQSHERLSEPDQGPGGKLVYVDGQGRRRRLPADMSKLTREERLGAISALSSSLGAPDPDYARLAAIERLTEMRAAGTVSEENFERERRRLMGPPD